jgi:hypothetical protein
MSDDLILGRLLGRREAFSIVAARCCAADAATLREIREKKLYLAHAADWGEFCTRFLHTSKESANRIIYYLEQFGPTYFEVSQFTRISPATYRAIAPSIREQALHHNGDAIALIPENAEKVAAAVAEIRKAAATPAPRPQPAGSDLDKRCRDLVLDLRRASEVPEEQTRVRGALFFLLGQINDIATSMR